MTAAIIVGLLTTGGVYLVLQRGIVRMALGFVLLGHAATTLLVASGGVARRGVPFIGASGEAADPLPQAFALTAIVISFGITAFLLTLAFRGRETLGDDDVERTDAERADATERIAAAEQAADVERATDETGGTP
jgi:multicomponent Na+:H+ antiporter subunit C